MTYVSSESIACAWQQLKKDIQTAAESQNAGGENIPAKAGGRLGMLQEVRAHEGAQEIDQQPELLAGACAVTSSCVSCTSSCMSTVVPTVEIMYFELYVDSCVDR